MTTKELYDIYLKDETAHETESFSEWLEEREIMKSDNSLFLNGNNFVTVNILGQPYKVFIVPKQSDDALVDCEGYTEPYDKIIVVSDLKDTGIDEEKRNVIIPRLLRHEIIHAFLCESGLQENWEHKDIGQEETIVDWFAIQAPKLYAAFREVGAI